MRSLAVMVLVAVLASGARATTFVVDSALDTDDVSADGRCKDGKNRCTLRAAVTEANRDPDADIIHFNIPGPGNKTIALVSDPPGWVPAPLTITHPLTIDATTQPGYAGTPVVEVDGSQLGAYGFFIDTTCAVRGLAIKNFSRLGMSIDREAACVISSNHFVNNRIGLEVQTFGSSPNTNTIGGPLATDRNVFSMNTTGITIWNGARNVYVVNNLVGTMPAGTAAAGNGFGIYVDNASPELRDNVVAGNAVGIVLERGTGTKLVVNNLIGTDITGSAALPNDVGVRVRGATSELRANTISGNTTAGISLFESSCIGTIVRANKIGTSADGLAALPNATGIEIERGASASMIGGITGSDRNLIAGNGVGVVIANTQTTFDITSQTRDHAIRGNWVGLAVDGSPLPNGVGVLITGAARNTVEENEIAHNTANGVTVVGQFALDNRLRRNSLHDNGSLAIDLDDDGVSSNDASDSDNGGNGLQNFPVLAAGALDGTATWISGSLASTASATFDVEVYASAGCDPAGYGEAMQYLGTVALTTNTSGAAGFLFSVPVVAPGTAITAAATTASGATSELSACVIAAACPAVTIPISDLARAAVGSAYSESVMASGGAVPYTFAVTAGSLPSGLTLAADGAFAGTPSESGTFGFTITATDAHGCTGSQSFTVFVCPAIDIAPADLASSTTMSSFDVAFIASGGTPGYVYAVSAGALPAGLTLNATGMLAGTAAQPGAFEFAVTATDAIACTGTRAYTLSIACASLAIAPSELAVAKVSTPFAVTLSALGGTPPYSFSASELPAGLTLSNAGELRGTPSTFGRTTVRVTVTDAVGCAATVEYALVIETDEQDGCGCQIDRAPQSLFAALIGSALLARRRRRQRSRGRCAH